MFVVPVVDSNVTSQPVTFPEGDNWVDWWNSTAVFTGGTSTDYPVSLAILPVFQRQGSILPLSEQPDALLRRTRSDLSSCVTLFIPYPIEFAQTQIRQWNGPSQQIWYTFSSSTQQIELTVTAHKRCLLVEFEGVVAAAASKPIQMFHASGQSLSAASSWRQLQASLDTNKSAVFFSQDATLWIALPQAEVSLGLRLIIDAVQTVY